MSTLNPLLSKVKLPGKVFTLPSKGIFYDKGVLAESVQNAEIHVKPMSALTEMKIKSVDLLLSGKVLREVCQECAPEILRPEKLVSKDIDALFCFLVMASYGSQKTIRATHYACAEFKRGAEPHTYQVDLERVISNPRNEALNYRAMLYTKTLSNGQTVNLRPITFESTISLMTIRQELNKMHLDDKPIPSEDLEKLVVFDLMSVVDSVEDEIGGEKIKVTDLNQIEEWLRALPKKLTDEITEAATKSAEWGFDLNVDLTCKDCKMPFKYELDLNPITFFSG